tara:strand:+ start:3585 stop:3761 length:177 start_codon:yes stop_codon:yes gene_type:complete
MDNINNAIIKIDKALDILDNIRRRQEEVSTDKIIKKKRYNTDEQLKNIFNNLENKLEY